jgi:hypothetical protein
MNLDIFEEPVLEFGGGGSHIDLRHGLMSYGPLDKGTDLAPTEVRLGVVGTKQTIEGVRAWLELARKGIAGKESRLRNLFPPFPGFSRDSCFGSSLVLNDRWCAEIRSREIAGLLALGGDADLVDAAVELFLDAAKDVLDQGGPAVLVCAPPSDLLAALDADPSERPDVLEEELDEGSEPPPRTRAVSRVPFHDLLKARGMRLAVPIQMVRPDTYSGGVLPLPKKRRHKGARASRPLQDEATRAWNLHTALYYKAGGILWRIVRDPADLTACFVGVSFYRSIDGDRLLTSVAQVFNERGEGMIVKGGPAKLDKDDRTPHLSEEDASTLLAQAIQSYRREHRTNPARVALHKTSRMNEAEIRGFAAGARAERIDSLDLLSVRRGFTRLFREGTYPPLRGTYLETGSRSGLVYLRGSVNFFATYPGMYVPRPLEFQMEAAESTARQLAVEILALSKLNWNNTQFDGGEPITVRAARRVGDILKCMPEGLQIRPAYRYFM